MKEYQVGLTAPPFHPNCRGTTCPYFDDDFGTRVGRDTDGNTVELPADTTYEEWKKKFVDFSENDDTIKSGAINGALNSSDGRAKKHAKRYYASVRKMTTDCKRIAENTGYLEEEIQSVKNYIFLDRHDLGNGKLEYFYPSYEMAETWQRLIDGKNIQKHDLTLLKHEFMEKELVAAGYSQDEAHTITSQKYNYNSEAKEYYAKINKH